MLQHEYVPHEYCLDENPTSTVPLTAESHVTSISLRSTDPGPSVRFTFEAIRPNLFRTTFSSLDHPLPPHPSALKPEQRFEDVIPSSTSTDRRRTVNLGSIKAVIEWTDTPVVSLYLDGRQKPIHRDLNFRSYAIDSTGTVHYTAYKRDTLHVGLGEKAAPMNLSNRHFIISATDCFGYDVYRTDPMYKHIPLLINVTLDGCVAMFSTSHSRGTWSVGSEVDGLWGHYKVYRQAYGGLEEYLVVGRTIKDVIKTYADLVGYPKLVPRWAMGYIAGGMSYSMVDEPRACDAHLEFVAKLKQHDIPCSAFQMSSGYTVAETEPKTRNVFTWNRHRFPDPKGFTAEFHRAGIRLIANVKPYVLANHPAYGQLSESGALYIDPRTKRSAIARLWSAGGGESGEGSHIDFTSEAGFKWWFEGVQALKAFGIDSIWNDNNEFVIPNDDWQCSLQKEIIPQALSRSQNHIGLWGRAMQTELMAKASHDALVDLEPNIRPFVLTRSATAGTMRYAASTWSGDNVTSWDGMKGANALSLNAGLSLLHSYGHDIGGFEGLQPSPELLLRWVQLGIYSPRFAINCFKTSPGNNLIGDVIEPWMYPEITSMIRDSIKRRYELIPYLYSLALDSHKSASPPQRWVGWGYESDPMVWTPDLLSGERQYWLGDALMIGGVYEPGANKARVYLPTANTNSVLFKLSGSLSSTETLAVARCEDAYINLNAPYQFLPAGEWVTITSEWKASIPVLAKVGSAIPVGKSVPTSLYLDLKAEFPSLVEDDYRGLEIFPPQGSSYGQVWSSTWYEDDGLSSEENTNISEYTISYSSTETEVVVTFNRGVRNIFVPAWKELSIILPMYDERQVITESQTQNAEDIGKDPRGRKVFKLTA